MLVAISESLVSLASSASQLHISTRPSPPSGADAKQSTYTIPKDILTTYSS